ncbi:hexitol phosphatase HxpB [Rheinheimera sp.]|uniref:hexitol phosphatase HxpB n=1 Tax=Rheinheimera sp. TaxID=1869214 RepID=UPI0037C85AD6
MIQAVIFDMDGVLIDSEPMWQQAELEVFSSLGVTICPKRQQQTVGMTTKLVTAHWYQQSPWSSMSLDEAEQAVLQQVATQINAAGVPKKGLLRLLDHLRQAELPVGLATNSPGFLMDTTLQKLQIRPYFSTCCSVEMVTEGKPAPDIYLLAAKNLGVAPEHCLVFEDSFTGMTAAKAAGMKVCALPAEHDWQHSKFDAADMKLRCLSELDFTQLNLRSVLSNERSCC